MNRLLVICGPTATGKTSLALDLAHNLKGELISTDSRQVYKYMDVVTGKDLHDGAKWHRRKLPIFNFQFSIGFWETKDNVRTWGYDIVRPDQDFSVSSYQEFAHKAIKDIYSRHKLPIVVGGTGLYIKSILEPLSAIHFPVDKKLRSKLSKLRTDEMFELLAELDLSSAINLNNSDRNNARRLVRKLEIAQFKKDKNVSEVIDEEGLVTFDDVLTIGLMVSDREKMKEIIRERVDRRLGNSIEKEIQFLKENNYLDHAPSKTIGYREWLGYLNGEYPRDEAVEKWKIAETSYAKRQMTWFRKQKNVNWFDVLDKDYKTKIEKVAEKWHNEVDNN